DIVAENVEFCRRRFARDARFEFHLCDGKTFPAKPTLAELHVERALRALGPKRRPVRIARQGRRLGSGRAAFTRLPHRARARECLMNCTRMGSIDAAVEPRSRLSAAVLLISIDWPSSQHQERPSRVWSWRSIHPAASQAASSSLSCAGGRWRRQGRSSFNPVLPNRRAIVRKKL